MIVGLDIGGTKVSAVLMDGGAVVGRHKEVFSGRTKEELLSCVLTATKAVWRPGVGGVGVSIAGHVKDGVLVFSPNLEALVGVDLSAVFSSLGVEVRFANDANCFCAC
jgi:predicted NBD/HSP70 family sugar kinase